MIRALARAAQAARLAELDAFSKRRALTDAESVELENLLYRQRLREIHAFNRRRQQRKAA